MFALFKCADPNTFVDTKRKKAYTSSQKIRSCNKQGCVNGQEGNGHCMVVWGWIGLHLMTDGEGQQETVFQTGTQLRRCRTEPLISPLVISGGGLCVCSEQQWTQIATGNPLRQIPFSVSTCMERVCCREILWRGHSKRIFCDSKDFETK